VVERARVAHARKRRGVKRPAKRKRTLRTRLGIIGLCVLAATILGFLTKRVMIPSVVHYLAYRPPDHLPEGAPAASEEQGADNDSENLTPDDRRQLDEIIKRKTK
jgi:hypothetical protein